MNKKRLLSMALLGVLCVAQRAYAVEITVYNSTDEGLYLVTGYTKKDTFIFEKQKAIPKFAKVQISRPKRKPNFNNETKP